MKKLIGAVLVGSMLLGACSEEVVKEETKAVEQKETATKTPEPAKKAEPKKAEPKKVVETEYLDSMSTAMKSVAGALHSISEESVKFSENPALIMDQGWIVDMAMAITLLDSSITQVRDIEEPEEEELKKAHTLVLKAMDHYQYVVDNYPSAIDKMDADAIRKCTENLSTATGYIQQASGIIADYRDNM